MSINLGIITQKNPYAITLNSRTLDTYLLECAAWIHLRLASFNRFRKT